MMRSLEHVADRVKENTKTLEPVFDNSSQQLLEADGASETIERAVEIARKNTVVSEDVIKVTLDQAKTIEKVFELSNNLTTISSDLEASTAKFNV